jgi:hypothetical protein
MRSSIYFGMRGNTTLDDYEYFKEQKERTSNNNPPYPLEAAKINIPKSMRKNKTFDEIQEMRKQIFITNNTNRE